MYIFEWLFFRYVEKRLYSIFAINNEFFMSMENFILRYLLILTGQSSLLKIKEKQVINKLSQRLNTIETTPIY
jgi:hypothetical protein